VKKNFLISIPISLFAVSVNFIYKAWAAQIISKEILGTFFTLVDAISFVMMIFIGFRSSMIASYAKYNDDKMIVTLFAYTIGCVTALLVLTPWMINPTLIHPLIIDTIIISFALYIYISNQLSIYKLYSLMNHLTFWEPLALLVGFGGALYFIGLQNENLLALSLISSTLLMSIIAGIGKVYTVGITPWKKVSFNTQSKEFLSHSLSSSVEFLAGMALIYIAVVVIVIKGDPHAIADFQVVAKSFLMYGIMMFVFPLFKFVLPEFATLYHTQQYKELLSLMTWFKRYSLILGTLIPLMWYLFGKNLLALAFPPTYASAYSMVLILSLFFGPIVYNGLMVAFLRGCGNFKGTLIIRLSGIIYFLLGYILLDFLTDGSANLMISIGLSYLFMAAMGEMMAKKHLNQMSKNTI
jgi:O-antigen/teichoic acid export membrane protein